MALLAPRYSSSYSPFFNLFNWCSSLQSSFVIGWLYLPPSSVNLHNCHWTITSVLEKEDVACQAIKNTFIHVVWFVFSSISFLFELERLVVLCSAPSCCNHMQSDGNRLPDFCFLWWENNGVATAFFVLHLLLVLHFFFLVGNSPGRWCVWLLTLIFDTDLKS